MLKRLIKDPLVHFTLVGAALFAVYYLAGSPDERLDENTIVVDRNALLTFIQYRSKAFEPAQARKRLTEMPQQERDALVKDYVREEALFREAKAMGMMENDYIVRRRSVQKLEFIAQGVAEQTSQVSDSEVETYFDRHRDDYYEAPSYSFTHVFLKSDGQHSAQRATALLQRLNADNVGFAEATRFGDRFLYHRNYVERTPGFIASHFGEDFGNSLSELETDNVRWQGPIASEHGLHLIKIREYRHGRVPALAEIRSRVESDFLRRKQQQTQEVAIQQIVEQYDVETRL
ncbi:peptidyl-prolyl cis-trans isomerase [Marinobacter alexandrii]|uniref:peptidylprolyl isomerase n=1 Tax=Marinobacter alexandrii TaxID=2570351 RepID=UPI001107BC60|nr:peptidylprolyl isomerase [Marinobacter alexandrii]